MINLTKRSFNLGILYVVFIIVVILIKTLYFYLYSEQTVNLFFVKFAYIHIVYYFLYINLLILVSDIVSRFPESDKLSIYFKLLIKLEVYHAILLILMFLLPSYGLSSIWLIIRIVIVLLYFLVFIQIMRIKKFDFPEITDLRYFAFVFIAVLIITSYFEIIFEFENISGQEYKMLIFRSLPFFFILRFLIRTKKYEYYESVDLY